MFPADATAHGNRIVFAIGEPGSIRIDFQAKEPGPEMTLGGAHMDFVYKSSFDPRRELEAYERLLHDAMLGDRTLFTRAEGIERLWEVAAPLLAAPPPVQPYAPGTWGPRRRRRARGAARVAAHGVQRRSLMRRGGFEPPSDGL